MRRSWGLRLRVLAAAGAIALVSTITFAILLNALLDQQRAAGPGRATSDARYAIGGVQRLALDLETGVRGYLLTGDREFLAPYTQALTDMPKQLDTLAAVPNDRAQLARIRILRRDVGAYTAYLATVVVSADRSLTKAREGKQRFDAIRSTLDTLDQSERDELTQRRAQSANLRKRAIDHRRCRPGRAARA